LRTGTFGTSSYRLYGLAIVGGVVYRTTKQGTGTLDNFPLLTLKPNTWYRGVLKAGTGTASSATQSFIVAAWEKDNPGISAIQRDTKDANWFGQSWAALFQVTSTGDVLKVDDYAEVDYYTTRYILRLAQDRPTTPATY
jgi:hypothetical protein